MAGKIISIWIAVAFLTGCNDTKNIDSEKTSKVVIEQIANTDTVILSIAPKVFKLSELPDTLYVTMTNNTSDTITTGLHYRIEAFINNEWKSVSPEDIAYQDIGFRLQPAEYRVFDKLLLKDQIAYQVGKYRIVKYYLKSDYQRNKKTYNLYAEFNIETPIQLEEDGVGS